MSEVPVPYGPQKKTDIERIAAFMNGFLCPEMLNDIPLPQNLQNRDYDDLDEEEQREWYEITLNAVFRDAGLGAAGLLGRQLKVIELNLIKRRIADYFLKAGIDYKKD
jgi:hypothetical protein